MSKTTNGVLTQKQREKIARRLARVTKLGRKIGELSARKKKLLMSSHADGLPLYAMIALPDGEIYELRKPEGRYVYFDEIELKKVPKNPRSPKGGSPQSEIGNRQSSMEAQEAPTP